MAYLPLKLGSTSSSAESITTSLTKVNSMLNELYSVTSGAIDWNNFTTSIIPANGSQIDLGSLSNPWSNLYVSADTIYLGDSTLTITAEGVLTVNGSEISPSVNYNDLIDAPNFSDVAFSGSYLDLTNTPDIPLIPTALSSFTNDQGFITSAGVTWNIISGKPAFAPVATSGNYNDLANKPSFTGLATETFVNTAIGNLVNTAPAALNTLSELASALGNDANFAGTVTVSLGNRLRIDINNQALTPTQKANAVNNLGLATVATTGSYNDLRDIPQAGITQVNSDWNAVSGVAQILNKPVLSTVATSGSYSDLSSKPTIDTLVPPQGGNQNKFLSTNGSAVFWNTLSLTSLTGMSISSPVPGQVLKYDGVNWYNGTDSTGVGGGGAMAERSIAAGSTGAILNDATANITITGYKGYALYKIQTSAAAWVRVYSSVAERTADASRLITVDPTPGSGVITEVITTGAQTINLAPGIIGFSNEATPSTDISVAVTNKSGSSANITVTLTLIQLEA